MNNQQLKYAQSRAEAIYKEARQKIYDKARSTSEDVKIDWLREGKYKVEGAGNWYSRIKFTLEPVDTTSADLAALKSKYDKIMDELMLGDAQQALDMLNKFRKVVLKE